MATTPNFDHYPLSASHLLNTAYSSLPVQEQRSKAASVGDEINGFFLAILEEAKNATSTWETKINAMDAMREMMKSVLLADNVIGQEIRKSNYCVSKKRSDGCTWDAKLDAVLDCWTDEDENKYFAEEERNGGVMTGRFRELNGLAKRAKVFKRMKDILMCVDRDVYVDF